MKNTDNRLDRLGEALHRAAAEDLQAAAAPVTKRPMPSWRRRGPRLALSAAVCFLAVTAALIVSAGGDSTPSAYAVEAQPGGGLKLEIYNLGDPEGVERALEEAGVAAQVNYLEPGMTCREPHYQPSMAMLRTLQGDQPQPQPWAGFNYESLEGPLNIAIGDYQQRRQMDEDIRQAVASGNSSAAEWPEFVIDPTGLRPDQTLIITSSPTSEDYPRPEVKAVGEVRVAEGEVGPCVPVPAEEASTAMAPIRAPEGGWDFSGTEYAGWGFGSGFRSGN